MFVFLLQGSSFADVRKKIIQNMAIKADQIKSGHVYFYFIDQGQSQVVEIEQGKKLFLFAERVVVVG